MSVTSEVYLIGVDGGGSGCRVAIGTLSSGVIARAEGGPANATSDPDLAVVNILRAVAAAAERASIDPELLESAVAHLGLAGVKGAADSQRIAAGLPFRACVVTEDRLTTINGALEGRDGFLVAVGTGSFVAASKGGALRYVGGWGLQLGDQASGAWLGRAALEQTLLCQDGLDAHSGLTRKLFSRFNDDRNAIVTFAASATPKDFGALAPFVADAARGGDAWGQALLQRGADYLARCLAVLDFQPGDTLCLTGGLGPVYQRFLPADHQTGVVAARGDALDGAFELARLAATHVQGSVR